MLSVSLFFNQMSVCRLSVFMLVCISNFLVCFSLSCLSSVPLSVSPLSPLSPLSPPCLPCLSPVPPLSLVSPLSLVPPAPTGGSRPQRGARAGPGGAADQTLPHHPEAQLLPEPLEHHEELHRQGALQDPHACKSALQTPSRALQDPHACKSVPLTTLELSKTPMPVGLSLRPLWSIPRPPCL